MHPCYLSKVERTGCLFEKDADLKLWPMGGGRRLLGGGCLFREWVLIRGNTLY